jgi:ATP-binding cassette subfamily B protein
MIPAASAASADTSPPSAPGAGRSPFRPDALRRHRLGRDESVVPRLGRARLWFQRRAVPVMLQMSAAECGAACLAMILTYHGRATTLEECREQCGVNRDGLSTRVLADVGRRFGLRVRGFSLEPAACAEVQLPAIVHWNFNHFVVVERFAATSVDIVDPAIGRQRLSRAEFDAAFTGVVLTFEPSLAFVPRATRARSPWRQCAAYVFRSPGVKAAAAQILLATLLLQVLGLGLPLLTGLMVDRVLANGAADLLNVLGLGVLAIVAAVARLSYLRAATLVYLRSRLDAQMMLGFFEHLLGLPFRFFEGRKTGQLVSRLGSNAVVRETLTNQTLSATLDGALVLGYLLVLLVAAPGFAGLVLALAALQIGLVAATGGQMQRLVARELAAYAESQGYLVEALKGMPLLKASGAEPRVLAQWSNLFSTQLNLSTQRGRLATLVDATMSASRLGSPLVLLWFGARWVLDGGASLGTMLGLSALAAAALIPLASLLASAQAMQLVGAHLQRIVDVLDAVPEQAPGAARSIPELTGRIEVRQVSFRYAPTAPLAVKDVSFSIEPGQKVALVGRSGSGKSTLAMLLLGLYPTSEGTILYDGAPVSDLDLRALRGQIGVVLQDPFLFSTTIRHNVAYHEPNLPLDDVVAAARLAAIDDEIGRMPLGYDTLLAEGGATLSGGQRQRLQLARAIARQPRVLLLDEATSHLDVLTERQVDANLSRLSCTRIVIAHRLSTIENADQILVFRDGSIVERGTHAQLLARDGHYAELVTSQLRPTESPR